MPVAALNETLSNKSPIDSVFASSGVGLPVYFLGIVALAMVAPLVIDMILAYRKKTATTTQSTYGRSAATTAPVGMPGLYRTVITFGIILLIGTILFYVLSLISTNNANVMNMPLIDTLRKSFNYMGTALATIIAFYFGIRGSESAVSARMVIFYETRIIRNEVNRVLYRRLAS
jgi:hypothetical protein